MRRPTLTRDPYKVGIAAFVALGLLGAFIAVISTVSFGTRTYTAHLAHSAGLRTSESVQVAGVDVGQVKSIELDGSSVKVTFTVDKGIHLGRDTTAEVKVSTLLGTHLLQIDPKGAGTLSGDTIPLAHTMVPYNLQDVIDRGTGALDEIDSAKLAEALSTVADTLKAGGKDYLPALQGIDRVSLVVATRTGQLGDLLTAARQVTDQLSSSSGDLVSLMQQTNIVVTELVKRRAAIHRLLVEVSGLAVAVEGMIQDTNADIGPVLADLHTVLTILRSRDKELKSTLHKLAVTGRYIANAGGSGRWIDLDVAGTPDNVYCLTGGGCK